MKRSLLLGSAAALLVAVAPAQAATQTLSAARAVERDCTSRLMPGAPGVVTRSFTAPAEGTVTAHLRAGSRAGDWDLAAFDSAGDLIAGSAAFRANEVVEANLRKGTRITLQACRLAGKGRRVPLATRFAPFDFEKLAQQGPTSLVEVPVSSGWQIDALERLGLDVTHDVHDGHARVMLYGDRDREILANTGLGFEVVRADVAAAERAFRAQDRRWARAIGYRSSLPTGRTEYRTFEEVQQELKDMLAQFPQYVRGFTLKTKTYEGRDIQVLEIAENVGETNDGRPVLFLNGIHHAREWPATEVLLEFVWDVLRNHKTNPAFARILRDVRIVLNPYTNVDGFVVSRNAPRQEQVDPTGLGDTVTGVVLLGGSFGYKRKNCNPYPAPELGQPCEFEIGTDNNRNYPHTWGGRGASTNPNDQSFRGSGPGSEPETKAIQELQLALNAPVLLSMHNIAAKVLRPPGTEAEGLAPDEEGLRTLGERMAEPTGYANEFGHQLYDVTGGTKDWAYAVTGSFGYTIETGPADGDFHGPYEEVVVNQYENETGGMRQALIAAAEWTRNEQYVSRITGRAPAGRTLRIRKDLITLTSPVCAISGVIPLSTTQETPDECINPGDVIEVPEKLDITMRVPESGRFTWWVNPSSRPYAKAPEPYKLSCEQDGKVVQETDVVVNRGQSVNVDLACGGSLSSGGSGGGALKIGKVTAAGRQVRAAITASEALKQVRVAVLRGRKVLASKRVKSLTGTRRVAVKVRRKLRRGKYTLRVSAAGVAATTKKFRVR